jgi:hypothetical protein
MRLTINVWKFALLVAAGWSVQASAQTAAGCGHGFDDNTCIPLISVAPQPQPQCSTAAGWTTASTAVWQGSGWSSPECTYTPPPQNCPVGDTEISPPVWNGESWSAPVCQAPPAPTLPTTQDLINACVTDTAQYSGGMSAWNGGWDTVEVGPSNVVGTSAWEQAAMSEAPGNNMACWDFGDYRLPAANVSSQMLIILTNPDYISCFFQPGTTNLIGQVAGWFNFEECGGNGG